MGFIGQSVGLLLLRHRHRHNPDALPQGWRMPLFPLPCYIQIFLFTLVFITTDSVLIWGSATPTLEMAIAFFSSAPACTSFVRSFTAIGPSTRARPTRSRTGTSGCEAGTFRANRGGANSM